jgi:ubiquinone/menaquinone biosynthesis C-methylase UbiE
MDKSQIKNMVKNKYADIAAKSKSCGCGCGSSSTSDYAKLIGYKDAQINSVPDDANLGLGCGNPTAIASLKKGEIVLDLGSGAGFDAFIASKFVGESGKVIGVDMTPQMVAKAKETAKKTGKTNVDFRLGEIEKLPVDSNSIDAIISNCVINLSTDKPRVFQEAHRVLKTGGRLMVSDIVLENLLPESVKKNIELYTGCIAGASLKKDYLSEIEKAGFENIKITGSSDWLVKIIKNKTAKKDLEQKFNMDFESLLKIAKSVKSIQVLAWKL